MDEYQLWYDGRCSCFETTKFSASNDTNLTVAVLDFNIYGDGINLFHPFRCAAISLQHLLFGS
jgi:hypothetical protein